MTQRPQASVSLLDVFGAPITRRKRKKGWKYASDAAIRGAQSFIFKSHDQVRVVHETSYWRWYRRCP